MTSAICIPLALLFIALSGCTTLPAPLKASDKQRSESERQYALTDRSITGGYLSGWRIGPNRHPNVPQLFEYIGRDGPEALKKRATSIYWSRVIATAVTLIGAPFVFTDKTHWAGEATVVVGVSALFTIDLAYTTKLISDFNTYLSDFFGIEKVHATEDPDLPQ